jgi:hypothetical protein
MFKPVHSGFFLMTRQKSVLLIIFLWQALWSWIYFTVIKEVVQNVMLRFPNDTFSPVSRSLFSFEGEFLLLKTSFAVPTLSVILTLLSIRYLFSPIIQAGLYYSLKENRERPLYQFLKGIRKWGLTFYLTNGVKWLLIALPLFWLVDYWSLSLESAYRLEQFLSSIISSLLWYFGYVFVVYMWVMWVQIRAVHDTETPIVQSFFKGLWFMVRHLISIIILFVTLLFFVLLLTAVFEGIAYFLAGGLLLLTQQLSVLWRVFGKVWFLSTWMELYKEKNSMAV